MKIHHFRPKRQKDTLLYQIMLIVAVLHIVALLVLGSVIISQQIINPQEEFKAPPPAEKVNNQKKQYQTKARNNQRRSQKLAKRIQIQNARVTNVSNVNISLPSGSIAGGSFTGTPPPKGFGDLDLTATNVSLIGIQSKTEKVLIVIDASSYLMNEQRGGLETYRVIKDDVKRLVNALPPTVLFNVMAYSTTAGIYINLFSREGLIPATESNKKRLPEWLDPINSSLTKIGVSGNYRLKYPFLPQPPSSGNYNIGVSTCYRFYQAALEQGADTIYFLATEWTDPDRIMRPWTDSETEKYRRETEKYEEQIAKARAQAGWTEEKEAEYQSNVAIARADGLKKARAWIEKENAARKAKGKSLYVGTPEQAMREQKLYIPPKETPPNVSKGIKKPNPPKFRPYGIRGIIDYYRTNGLLNDIYFSKKAQMPVLNMIVFRGPDEKSTEAQNSIIKSWTARHRGKSRLLRGLKADDGADLKGAKAKK